MAAVFDPFPDAEDYAMNRLIRSARRLRRLGAVVSLLSAASASAADLTVRIDGVRNPVGQLMLSLVDSPAGWDNQARPVAGRRVAADAGTIELVFPDLVAGDYALMVFHDENDNGKLDSNLIGMPVEGYGFSNNPRVMRKPTWEESRFTLAEDGQVVVIDLR